ncbi:MAG: hypothetical protein ABFS86_01805 [Planctomycetota bacterium]
MLHPNRRTVLVLFSLLVLLGVLTVVWRVREWPPPRLLLRYGLPSAAEPTGRVRVVEGIEFVEWGPGYRRVGSHEGCLRGDLPGRVSSWLGLPWGEPPDHRGRTCPPTWVDVPYRFCIARRSLTAGQYWRLVSPERRIRSGLETEKELFRRNAQDFVARLCTESGERVRLPRRQELIFSGWGARTPYLAPWSPRFTPRHANEWYLEIPDTPGNGSRLLPFRPVLIPPDD